MILGLGSDICPAPRWAHLVERFGPEKCCAKILHPEEAAYLLKGNRERLPERLAGRWALREAFGKALGVGLDGWSWRQLRYINGRLWTVDKLTDQMKERGVTRLHGTVAHDGGMAVATVILEGIGTVMNADER